MAVVDHRSAYRMQSTALRILFAIVETPPL